MMWTGGYQKGRVENSAMVIKELPLKSLKEKEAYFVLDTLMNQAQMFTYL